MLQWHLRGLEAYSAAPGTNPARPACLLPPCSQVKDSETENERRIRLEMEALQAEEAERREQVRGHCTADSYGVSQRVARVRDPP